LEQQERLNQGSQFHLLMQQWQLGLPVERLLAQDALLQRWFTTFINAAPTILQLESDRIRQQQTEHTRTLEIQGYLLTVVYDLLLSGDRTAKILDWKTYARPRRADRLLQNWQTRLYLFVLAETSAYPPDHLSMVYWFFQAPPNEPPQAQHLNITYDREQHEQTRRDLTAMLNQLNDWLHHYQQGQALPQVRVEAAACDGCSFAAPCSRLAALSPSPDTWEVNFLNVAAIQEVPL
jgi:hypothetical protein